MSDGFSKLKEVGVQKIHEATHISREHIQAILHENFDDMTKVQIYGFISILEREYHIGLDKLKNSANLHFNENPPVVNEEESVKVFLTPTTKRNYTPFYIAIVVIIFVVFAFLSISSSSKVEVSNVTVVDNSAIDSAKDNMVKAVEDLNISEVVEKEPIVEPQIEPIIFKIMPKSKVWLGYIELTTNKKAQTTFSESFELNASKDWLLVFGHGHIDIDIDGVVTNFRNPKTVRFLYKDSKLKEITYTEFKELNRGNAW